MAIIEFFASLFLLLAVLLVSMIVRLFKSNPCSNCGEDGRRCINCANNPARTQKHKSKYVPIKKPKEVNKEEEKNERPEENKD